MIHMNFSSCSGFAATGTHCAEESFVGIRVRLGLPWVMVVAPDSHLSGAAPHDPLLAEPIVAKAT
ncbi:MAG: hypothetical protein JSR91_26365 [Proteobacteria bacterium]|nr:hypothetical protein [Pseudomonadota bacterium]